MCTQNVTMCVKGATMCAKDATMSDDMSQDVRKGSDHVFQRPAWAPKDVKVCGKDVTTRTKDAPGRRTTRS